MEDWRRGEQGSDGGRPGAARGRRLGPSGPAADAAAIGAVQARCWRAAYAGLAPREALDRLDAAALADRWRVAVTAPPSPRHAVLVACSGSTVVGFAALAPSADDDASDTDRRARRPRGRPRPPARRPRIAAAGGRSTPSARVRVHRRSRLVPGPRRGPPRLPRLGRSAPGRRPPRPRRRRRPSPSAGSRPRSADVTAGRHRSRPRRAGSVTPNVPPSGGSRCRSASPPAPTGSRSGRCRWPPG